ncbi:MAG: 50S ribosomal protein L21 [Pseudomonadota bacterium]|nr:50S ribosomal protein L21 [Pseudomonadota bacterium]
MFAVVETGGKQYKVVAGQTIDVEKLDVEPGETLELDRVLLVGGEDGTSVGTPYVDGAKVLAKVAAQIRGEKIRIVKMRRRKHSQSETGHRQYLTQLEITGIQVG